MSTVMRAMIVTMWMQVRRKTHRKPMMDPHRMWRTAGIGGLTWEPEMLPGMNVSIATMPMRMWTNMHHKRMMDHHRMLSTEGVVLQSMKIGLYISDL
jgi:hypothetical protein